MDEDFFVGTDEEAVKPENQDAIYGTWKDRRGRKRDDLVTILSVLECDLLAVVTVLGDEALDEFKV